MRRFGIVACLASLILFGGRTGLSQENKEPQVRIVKYDGLAQEVLKHRGKVVLVDIWFTL